jgi:hypothetical protein
MFVCSVPVERNCRGNSAVEDDTVLQGTYDAFARWINSAFTWLEAFGVLCGGQTVD